MTSLSEPRAYALEEVKRAMAALGLTNVAVAERAGLDPGTIGDFLAGRRWPRRTTLAAIDKALEWSPGRIEAMDAGFRVTYDSAEVKSEVLRASGVDQLLGDDWESLPTAQLDLHAAWLRRSLEDARVRVADARAAATAAESRLADSRRYEEVLVNQLVAVTSFLADARRSVETQSEDRPS